MSRAACDKDEQLFRWFWLPCCHDSSYTWKELRAHLNLPQGQEGWVLLDGVADQLSALSLHVQYGAISYCNVRRSALCQSSAGAAAR